MSSTANAEDESKYNENLKEMEEDIFYKLFAASRIPCFVVLERLTEEEIQRHLSIVDERFKPERTQKRIAKNFLRDVPRVDFGLFDQYKRTREAFFNKKRNPSADIGDFGFSSGEEPINYSDEEYVPEESLSRKHLTQNRKRKKVAYEDDYEWNPDGRASLSPKPKKALRSLRVNTRRKRIESNSSSDEDDYEARTSNSDPFDEEDVSNAASPSRHEPEERNKTGTFLWGSEHKQALPTREVEGYSASFLDPDLITQIVQDMEDFRKAEGMETGVSRTTIRPKKRISRLIKITDALTPTISEVQQVVRNIVNSVCTHERQREQAIEDSLKVPCRWCDSMFLPEKNSDGFCKICKDMHSKKNKGIKKTHKVSKSTVKSNAKSKMKSKVLKNLPKSEQQRLLHSSSHWKNSSSKSFVSAKDVNDRHLTTVAEVHHQPQTIPSESNQKQAKKRKLKKSTHVGISTKSKATKTPVSEKIAKKSLLRIDFPDPVSKQASASDSPQQNVIPKQSNSVQYGTYLLPPVPTVVVANYAATDAKNGDYYLSSVYYQNEMTQPKNTIKKNAPSKNTANLNQLPSMPSIDQLSSMPSLEHLSNFSISPLTLSQSSTAVSLSRDHTNAVANSVDESQIPSDPSYLTEQDIAALFNNSSLVLQPAQTRTSNVTTESDIASLFSNPHLQIQPLGPPNNIGDYDDSFSTNKRCPNEDSDLPLSVPLAMNKSDFQSSKESTSVLRDTVEASKTLTKSSVCQLDKKTQDNTQPDHQSEEDSEEDMSSEALFRKMSDELDAICILGVVDLDKNPKLSLERIIETNKVTCENLTLTAPENTELLKKAEDNRSTLHLAKTLLNRFGSFTNMSNYCLRSAMILQIKKEKVEKDATRSSCQFAAQSQSIPEFIEVGAVSIDHIANIETQINSIPSLVTEPGVVHHFPTPGIPRSESRETPSRGSGPLTPARPESAFSQLEEPAPLTPIQIKKEHMEAENSPQTLLSPSVQPSRTILPHSVVSKQVPPGNLIVSVSNQMAGYSSMVSASSQIPSTNQSTFILTQRNHPLVQYRTAGGPPNVTATNNPNISKVLMDFASRHQPTSQNINNNNVLFKNGQVVNVQQVYLPSPQGLQQRFNVQQQNPAINQFNIVQQSQNQVIVGQPQNQVLVRQPPNPVLVGQPQTQVLVNNVGGQYSFQSGQVLGTQQRIANPSLQTMQHVQPGSSGQVVQGSNLLLQNKPTPNNSEEQMFCALCGKPATLRCKQCAKIAYCDTTCAKTYWHSKHKSECKPMGSVP